MASRISFVSPNGTWISGAVAPTGSDGYVTQFYLDTVTGSVYEKTALTTWTLRTIGSGGGGISGGANLGAGEGVYAGVTGANINFKSLVAGSNISITSTGTEITIGAIGSGITTLNGLNATTQYFAIDSSGTAPNWSSVSDTHTLNIPSASVGGVTAGLISNTDYASFSGKVGDVVSIGGGESLVGADSGTSATIKSLVAGTGVSFTSTADEVTINSTAGISGGANLGTGEGVYASTSGGNLEFKSLTAGSGVSLSSSATEIQISASGSGVTIIPDGGTMTGTYTGDVLLEGTATMTSDVIVNGNIFTSAGASNLNTSSYDLDVAGDVILKSHTIRLNTNPDGLSGSSINVKGNLYCQTINISGISSNPHYSGASLTVGGNLIVSGDITGNGATGTTDGGGGSAIQVSGDIIAGSVSLNGAASTSLAGSVAGNAGYVFCSGNIHVNSSDLSLVGGIALAGSGSSGGSGGNVDGVDIVVSSGQILSGGGDGVSGGGNGGVVAAKNTLNCIGVSTNGGSAASAGFGGAGGNIAASSIQLNFGSLVTKGGDGATTGGNAGLLACNSMSGACSLISMSGGSGGSGSGGDGGTITCYGPIVLDLDEVAHTMAGGDSTSGSGGFGGQITCSNLVFGQTNSALVGLNVNLSLKGGNTSTGLGGGQGGIIYSSSSIVTSCGLDLSGGDVTVGPSPATNNGRGGAAGYISFGDRFDLRFNPQSASLKLDGGQGVAGLGTGSGGNGGRIQWSLSAGGNSPSGGDIIFSGPSSLPLFLYARGGQCLSGGSGSNLGTGGNGGRIYAGSLSFEGLTPSVWMMGGTTLGTGNAGSGGIVSVVNSIVSSTGSFVLDGGANNSLTNGSGGGGGAITARNGKIRLFGYSANGGAGVGASGAGGSGGSMTATEINVNTINLSGGAGVGGSGGTGGTIGVSGGNLTCASSLTFSGGGTFSGTGGGSGGNVNVTGGNVYIFSATANGGNINTPAVACSAGNGGNIRCSGRIIIRSSFVATGGNITNPPSVNGIVVNTGTGGTLGGIVPPSGLTFPDILSIGTLTLSGGSMAAGAATGSFSVQGGGTLEANNLYLAGANLSGGGITATVATVGAGENGSMTVLGNLVLGGPVTMSFGSSSASGTAAKSTANTLTVFGTTTARATSVSSGGLPSITMVGSSTTAAGGSGSAVTGFTFYGRVSGKISLTVQGGTASGGTVGRCGGIRFFGGCDIGAASVSLLETGSAGSTAPANTGTNGGLRFSGWCSIYNLSIRPFNAAREADMTFVCENAATGTSGATLGSINVGSFSYTHGDGTAAPATFVFRGVAGAAISGAEATTEPNTRHTYYCNSGTGLTYKVQGAPV
jgi:hypothetical protein